MCSVPPPCNVAQKVVDGHMSKLVAGVNLPMLLRTVNYRNEALDVLVTPGARWRDPEHHASRRDGAPEPTSQNP